MSNQIQNPKSKKKSRGHFSLWHLDFDICHSPCGGFTLLEMIVSLGMFSVLVIASIGVILEVSRAQAKTANLQTVGDNIRFSLELMTRELRTGNNYALTSLCAPIGSEITFTSFNQGFEQARVYFLDQAAGVIMRAKENLSAPADCANPAQVKPFTAEEVVVTDLVFRAYGTQAGPNDGQAWITIVMRAAARDPRLGADTAANLQTTISQRLREL